MLVHVSNCKRRSPYFAICVVVQNELDVDEWLKYHQCLGCSRFYFFDHRSQPSLKQTMYVHKLMKKNIIRYEYVDRPAPVQYDVYNQCLRIGRMEKVSFLAFIDADEFIVYRGNVSFVTALRRFQRFGGLVLNWKAFGSSGHTLRPAGGVLANYWQCEVQREVKSIVRPKAAKGFGNAHYPVYRNRYYAVDPLQHKVRGPMNPKNKYRKPASILFQEMYINHYRFQSLEDHLRKMRRGRADVCTNCQRKLEDFVLFNNRPLSNCGILQPPCT